MICRYIIYSIFLVASTRGLSLSARSSLSLAVLWCLACSPFRSLLLLSRERGVLLFLLWLSLPFAFSFVCSPGLSVPACGSPARFCLCFVVRSFSLLPLGADDSISRVAIGARVVLGHWCASGHRLLRLRFLRVLVWVGCWSPWSCWFPPQLPWGSSALLFCLSALAWC